MPIPVADRCKTWVCGHLLDGSTGSNPDGCMHIYLLWVLWVFRSLRRADHSSRGVLPTLVCRCVLSTDLEKEETLARVGS